MPTASRSSSNKAAKSSARTGRAQGDRPANPPERPRTLRPVVEWLTAIEPADHWVVSCYLKLEPRDRARGKYAIKLKNRIRDRLAWLERRGVDRGAREALGRDLERIRRYLDDSTNLPVGRGIALFACEGLELFEAVALPQVFRSRLVIDRSPSVRELAALDDEFGLVIAAVYDRHSARFFWVSALEAEEMPGLTATEATRGGKFHGTASRWGRKAAGTPVSPGEHNYHQRIREEKLRHYARIAERLFQLAQSDGNIRGIVLSGTGKDADAVLPHLHPYIATRVLGTAKLNPKSVTPASVMEAVLKVRRASERASEAEHVRALREGLGTGWAVNGIEASLAALARGQVRTLLVDPAVQQPGFRCDGSGKLTTTPTGCEGEGTAEAVPDVVDDAIEDALRQGAAVDVVEHAALSRDVAGLAALLRFPVRAA